MKHMPGVMWPVRKIGKWPNACVDIDYPGLVTIKMAYGPGQVGKISMTRPMARMLAKRINQCLDDSK
jgi:hypothetical protein